MLKYLAVVVLCVLSFFGGTLYSKETKVEELVSRKDLNHDNLLIYVNEERIKAGLPMFSVRRELREYADERAFELSDGCAHTLAPKTGKAENIVCGVNNPKETVSLLMQSPTHREVLLSQEYSSIGIGARYGNVALIFE
jgi:uncharacterized protein YkwD